MKKLFFMLIPASLVLTGCQKQVGEDDQSRLDNKAGEVENQNQMVNPASAYCEEQGGTLAIITRADGNQFGICKFADQSECEEWSYFRGECLPVSESEDISELIKQLFMDKYNKDQEEVRVNIVQQTENYARGGVKFGEGGIGEGGIFLVAKTDGQWQLVFDGNGMISCSVLEPYDFPQSMALDCI